MKTMLIAAGVVYIAAIAAAFIPRSHGLRLLGSAMMLLYVLGLAAAALLCFIFPFFTPHGSNAAVMMLPGLVAALFAYIAWVLWDATRTYSKVSALPPDERHKWVQDSTEKMMADLHVQMASDVAEVEKFWISPRRRRNLRERIRHNEFMLENMAKLPELYDDHLRDKAKGKPPEVAGGP